MLNKATDFIGDIKRYHAALLTGRESSPAALLGIHLLDKLKGQLAGSLWIHDSVQITGNRKGGSLSLGQIDRSPVEAVSEFALQF